MASTYRRLRFSVRGLLVLTLLVALGLTWHLRRSRVHAVVEQFKALGATVEYHPSWFPKRIVGHFYDDAKSINLRRSQLKDEDLMKIGGLRRLEALDLAGTKISYKGLRHVSKLPSLKRLALWDCGRLEYAAVSAIQKLQELEVLDVHDTEVSQVCLRLLASMPSLKRLVFSSPQYNENYRFTSETITALSQVNAKPVGRLLLSKINDVDFGRITAMDLSQTWNLMLFESNVTARSLKGMEKHPNVALEFQKCPLNVTDLESLDCQTRPVKFYATHFTLAELASELSGFKSMIAQTHAIDFHSTLRTTRSYPSPGDNHVRMSNAHREEPTFGNQFTADVLRNLPNLETIICSLGMDKVVLEAIAEVQPSVYLAFNSRYEPLRAWQTIERCPSLTGLELGWRPGGNPRFTNAHQLKQLTIIKNEKNAFEPSTDFFREVAKLADLEKLVLHNDNTLSIEAIEPLRKLTKLRYVRLANLDEEARQMLGDMGLSLAHCRPSGKNEVWTFKR